MRGKTMRLAKKRKKEIISEIEFYPIMPKQGVIAFVSFIYQNMHICDCALVTRPQGGYRLSYPIKQLPNGKTVQCVYPIDKSLGASIEEIVILNYERFLLNNVHADKRK